MIWISRSDNESGREYKIWNNKPKALLDCIGDRIVHPTHSTYVMGAFCKEAFHRMSNVRLENGDVRKIKDVKMTFHR